MLADPMPILHIDQNDITRRYNGQSHAYRNTQDSIIRAYCGSSKQQLSYGKQMVSPRDSIYHYSEPIGPLGPYPDHIFNYALYTPAAVTPSRVYFATLDAGRKQQ